ncbi:MAG: hypothetical protein K6G03_02175 [Lachnospiraceae bacterium]|nr:hypothetical protein [Lachnospiraceae bacterium]
MAWDPVLPEYRLDNIKEDKKDSVCVEQYRVSKRAIYFKGQYLPISQIKTLKLQESTYSPNCCCGKGIPVFKLRLDHGIEKPLVFMIEKRKNADKMVAMILERNPDIQIETV